MTPEQKLVEIRKVAEGWLATSLGSDAGAIRRADACRILAICDQEGARGDEPIPMILFCMCGQRHIDEGEFATKPHHTHACQACGIVWRPAIGPTVGVQFLPGFKNEPAPPKAEEPAACRNYDPESGFDGDLCRVCGGAKLAHRAPAQPDGERHEFVECDHMGQCSPAAYLCHAPGCGQLRSAACHRQASGSADSRPPG